MQSGQQNSDKFERTWEPQGDPKAFFDGLPHELLYAACRGLEASLHPMAYVSEQLMVLRQTDTCRGLLADAGFYSIEGILPEAVCETIRQCIHTNTEQAVPVTLMEKAWELRIIPTEHGALLVFAAAAKQQIGVTLAASHLRDSAQSLLLQAEMLEQQGMQDAAAQLRWQAMRILRQVNHMQLLAGAPEMLRWTQCSACRVLQQIEEQLAGHDIRVAVSAPQPDITFYADEGLVMAALLTLVSNSLRHGGPKVHIALSAEKLGGTVSFGVADDGAGIEARALARMNDTWRQPDAVPGAWGLGIPYARKIASMHSGLLLFLQGKKGGTSAYLRIPLEAVDADALESDSGYQTILSSGLAAADIELSDVLDAAAYRRA
ncbi:MAG: HAMP domain-containing sensor histidine kinase [Eubacteriales bacterium]|nr:HAMP domain-containing sensor histidine kinase [Eubacteriales bacterium]